MTRTAKCKDCSTEFAQEYVSLLGVDVADCHHCASCLARLEAEEARRTRTLRLWRFDEECPELFRKSDQGRFPAVWEAIKDWEYNPRGIGLVGESGFCKTRMLWTIARRIALATGIIAKGTTHSEIEFLSQRHWEGDNALELRRIARRKLLILDDFSKGSLDGATARKLFEIIDYRTSHRLPTLWTSNLSGSPLKAQFGGADNWQNIGIPLLGRLKDFSEMKCQSERTNENTNTRITTNH